MGRTNMQYILTQKEYDKLLNGIENEREKLKTIIETLCTDVTNNKPILYWGNKKPKIWECIRTNPHASYCDECSVQNVCPYKFKQYSK